MTASVVTISAKRDAVKFSTLVNGKRRTIFFDKNAKSYLTSMLCLKGSGDLSSQLGGFLIYSQTLKKFEEFEIGLSLSQWNVLKEKTFKFADKDGRTVLTRTNGQYGYVKVA